MKTTIGKHWPHDAPIGDYRACCDSCGVPWQKSKMRRSNRGALMCPDCYEPRDEMYFEQDNMMRRSRNEALREAIAEYERR